MQRRIGLAQALINDPDLVILDEPTAGLDPIGCHEIKQLILAWRDGEDGDSATTCLADVPGRVRPRGDLLRRTHPGPGTLQELLAEPDEVRITSPVLSRDTLQKALEILRHEAGDRVRVDTPTQNLESFLGVVERARGEGEHHEQRHEAATRWRSSSPEETRRRQGAVGPGFGD